MSAQPVLSPQARTRAVLIDLDGTMVHTAPDIVEAASRMLADFGHAPLPFDTVSSFIGKGVPNLVRRTLEAAALDRQVDMSDGLATFHRHYEQTMASMAMCLRTSPPVSASFDSSATGLHASPTNPRRLQRRCC